MAATYCQRSGKQMFPSQSKAANALRRLGHGNVYRCNNCHDWHISHASMDQLVGKRLRREQGR